MFSRFAQKHIFMISGLYFWSLGSQKYAQERPEGTFKISKAPILSPQSHEKSIKSGHWTSKVMPGTPKAPKIDEKVTPDASRHLQKPKYHKISYRNQWPLNGKMQNKPEDFNKTHALNWPHRCRQTSKTKHITLSFPNAKHLRGAAVSRQAFSILLLLLYFVGI